MDETLQLKKRNKSKSELKCQFCGKQLSSKRKFYIHMEVSHFEDMKIELSVFLKKIQ